METLKEVIRAEREWIVKSRAARRVGGTAGNEPSDLVGLALSSGGYRSAYFSFGVLQGLARCGLLQGVDYLSSVGGGAYPAAWLLSTLTRGEFAEAVKHLFHDRNSLPTPPAGRPAIFRNLGALIAAALIAATPASAVFVDPTRLPFFKDHIDWLIPASALIVLTGALLALVVARSSRFSLHTFVERQITDTILAEKDVLLADVGVNGPYPLFGASVDGPSPYLLSPKFQGPIGASFFAGYHTLASAVAISSPTPDAEPNHLGRLARSVLNAHASPLRFVEDGTHFDPLGVYSLLERRCAFVIACDATTDEKRSFAALATVIRTCRVSLGIEIQIGLGVLGAAGGDVLKHYQLGTIRYPDGTTGVLLYIRPTMTGDEPADLVQYAAEHPAYPDAPTVRESPEFSIGGLTFLRVPDLFKQFEWDDAAAETYRRLGEHTVETLAREVKDSTSWGRVPVAQAFHDIQATLRPDLRPGSSVVVKTELPPELVAAIASGECVLCTGAGLAAQAGLPTWPALFEGLLRAGRERGVLTDAAAAELAQSINLGDLEEAGDELVHQIPEDARLAFLTSALPANAEPSEAHRLLAEMRFVGALNTSLDDVVARAFGARPLLAADTQDLIAALGQGSRFVANVSGSPGQPASIVLNERQFRVGLSANAQFRQFLTTIFLRYHTFFVGSNIDGVRGFYDALALTTRPDRRQFALLAHEGPLDPVKVRYLDRTYNVLVIEYEPGFNFEGFPAYFRGLRDAVRSGATPVKRETGAPILKRVTLQNIGPFEELSLDLTPTWNLLLGDNGKGKTMILRAIATALCGEQADPAMASRLLRTGSNAGSITLTVDTREYTVKLTRGADDRVRIESASLSPLQSDGWLAIGFPALRSVPWDNPSGPAELSSTGPQAQDLLPLLRGVPDNRVANLKQWLVNLDYAGRAPVIQRFFDVLQALTPGLRLTFAGVNRVSMDIQLRSDAGVIPLSAVSQGTGSVMCWVGTLIQRMSEVGIEPDGRALILIDELDAHMHPKWQQMFISAFREHFKNVQVIATSHSPLLVGSLTKDEIWLTRTAPIVSDIYGVARVTPQNDGTTEVVVTGPEPDAKEDQAPAPPDERRYVIKAGVPLRVRDGEIVEESEPITAVDARNTVERLEIPAEGWRVDQILTMPYFGLETTRDPKTANAIDVFTKYSVQPERTRDEQAALEDAAAVLQARAPAPHESAAAREAFKLISEFASQRLEGMSDGEREKVLAEVQVQILESITNERRPM